jgi:hypothetical protein
MGMEVPLKTNRILTMAEWPPQLVSKTMSDELLIENARAYARRHQLELAERLGFGVHGIVFLAENKANFGKSVLKIHRMDEPFQRELSIYEMLSDEGIIEVLGFNIPALLGADPELRIIEMSLVARPFVLDFAGAYLDKAPEFSEEIWADWRAEKREQFGNRWPAVEAVLSALKRHGIQMVDVTPSNIAFAD